jgi:2,5-diketo-D-gluconate reductase B
VDRILEAHGAKMPAVGLGTWKLKGRGGEDSIREALEAGYRHIDTAQLYENEVEVGRALRDSAAPRDQVFVTTKIHPDNAGDRHLQHSVEQSLVRLGLHAVDLVLLHWPSASVPLRETMRALADVKRCGYARHIGVSNFPVALLDEAVHLCAEPLVTNQVEYHPFLDQTCVLAACRRHGMILTAYSPLAQGRVRNSRALGELARKRGVSATQIALAWLLAQDDVAVIPRASSVAHARENLMASDLALDAGEIDAIDAMAEPDGRIVNPVWGPKWDEAA